MPHNLLILMKPENTKKEYFLQKKNYKNDKSRLSIKETDKDFFQNLNNIVHKSLTLTFFVDFGGK